ncbi:Os08g0176756 [Oryza sativa Japonica Group]|uniref:Os08g0176756 protein n=1 Tax=Oryza sativa subsp. japonica TaxID=39947 RepID=A0A0P0XCD7_ORYSJ|nr:Os08g0176756 [Oryza sativa Japonica Group]
MFSFGTFDFVFDASGQIQQVSPGVVVSIQDIRFPAGARFRFGELNFTTNKAGVLRPMTPRASSPAATSLVPFGLANFTAVAAKIGHVDNFSARGRVTTTPPRRPGHHGRSKHRRP